MEEYEVILRAAEEGGFTVSCPALPGCVSEGDTVDEALGNIRDAIKGYLEVLRKHGETPPRV